MTDTLTALGVSERRQRIVEYLTAAKKHDAEKHLGQPGWRGTREISEGVGLTMATIRNHCWALYGDKKVEAADGGAACGKGNPIDWRLADG